MKKSCKKHSFILILATAISLFLFVFFFLVIIYPSKYTAQINRAADKYGLSRDFVNAVIRTESRFDASAVSNKGAVGLMQLMPATAEWLLGAEITTDTLKNIEINIELGCKYLRYLADKFVEPDIVLAAYNAGEGNVRTWLEREYAEIPFKETRKYIRKVRAAESVYRFKSIFRSLLL